jgi:hypothetical protein
LAALALPKLAAAQDQAPPPGPDNVPAPANILPAPDPQGTATDANAPQQIAGQPPAMAGAMPGPGPQNQMGLGKRDQRNMLEGRLRGLMVSLGVQDPGIQDALVSYLEQDEKSKSEVRDASRRIFVALKRGVTPDRMRDLIASYKSALDNDRERRKQAQASLDAKIGYSNNPNLEALLWVTGVLGDGGVVVTINQFNNNRMPNDRRGPDGGPRLAQDPDGGLPPGDGPIVTQTYNGLAYRPPTMPMNNVSTGIVVAKTDNSINIRDENGHVEQYIPRWVGGTGLDGSFDKQALIDITRVDIGQRVRLEWTMTDRRRLVAVKALPPEDYQPPAKDQP